MNKRIFFILICIVALGIFLKYNRMNFPNNQKEEIVDLSLLINKTKSEKLTGDKIQVEIQNGCGLKGIAKLYANFLRNKGYDVISFKNASHFNYNKTELIIHKKDTSNFISEIVDILQINSNLVSYNYNDNFIYEMTIIIGNDYNNLESFDEVSMYYEPF